MPTIPCFRCFAVQLTPQQYVDQSGLCTTCIEAVQDLTRMSPHTYALYNRGMARLYCAAGHCSSVSLYTFDQTGIISHYSPATQCFYCPVHRRGDSIEVRANAYITTATRPEVPEPCQHDDEQCGGCLIACSNCARTCDNCGYCNNCAPHCSFSLNTCCECLDSHFHCGSCGAGAWWEEARDEDGEYCNSCYRQRRAHPIGPPAILLPCIMCSEQIEICVCSASV